MGVTLSRSISLNIDGGRTDAPLVGGTGAGTRLAHSGRMIATLSASVLALLIAQTTAPASMTATVPQWSTHEIALTATGQYTNPSVSVDLLGIFSGPDGKAVVVKGFWDGGQSFRIRFTPTRTGTWSFTTVSDDPGLDNHAGFINCVLAREGSHGFVRERAGVAGKWIYDDGLPATIEATTIRLPALGTPCSPADSPCSDSGGPRLKVDAAELHSIDERVRNASTAGHLVQLTLFESRDAGSMDQPRLYRDLEYMTARYGAFPNVVWCLPAVSAGDGPQALWPMARTLVMTLDPYFIESSRERVLRSGCSPQPARSSGRSS